jgi:hypothetical protein
MNDFNASAKVTAGDSLCLDQTTKALYASDRAYEACGWAGLLITPQLGFLDADSPVCQGWVRPVVRSKSI